MNYIALKLRHAMSEIDTDLCVDALAGAGFESFETEGNLLTAYIPQPEYERRRGEIDAVLAGYAPIEERKDELIPDRDWNAVWESSYEPVRFGNFCFVHAPFHTPLAEVKYNIEIEPKMSFGTAHHPTTSLMIRFLEEEPPVGKAVLDMGCGTGVLGILAAMQGAERVLGIDVDEWAYRNALENVNRNREAIDRNKVVRPQVEIKLGDAALLENMRFDCVLANIN
ncbi:MAG: 50S ribosomal protein L11 methyltransferase, partial [Bacteroidales bacterium]|nr:50S ribosomal protein L11 methyltransferase [Bacteroidales bacterium]